MNQLPETVVKHRLARRDADLRQRAFKPQPRQFLRRVRQDVDADANRLDLRHRFVHAAGNALRVQHQRKREAADAAANDQNFHVMYRPLSKQCRHSSACYHLINYCPSPIG